MKIDNSELLSSMHWNCNLTNFKFHTKKPFTCTLWSRYPYYRYRGRLNYPYFQSTDKWKSTDGELVQIVNHVVGTSVLGIRKITWSLRYFGSEPSKAGTGVVFRRLMSTSRMTSGWFDDAEISSKTRRLSKRAKFFSKSNSWVKSSRWKISDPKQSSFLWVSISRKRLCQSFQKATTFYWRI